MHAGSQIDYSFVRRLFICPSTLLVKMIVTVQNYNDDNDKTSKSFKL
jgi:hypothetical protein